MNAQTDAEWFTNHTTGAPAKLRAQVMVHFEATTGALTARLADAGQAALRAATAAGRHRAAALDLLAADALITLALLAAAEHSPATLAEEAAALRHAAAVDG